jgi:O-antigen ligase
MRRLPVDAPLISLSLVFAVAAFLTVHGGGIDGERWYAAGLVATALLAVTVLARKGSVRLRRALVVPLAGLAFFAAWSFASLLWSGDRGVAWDSANQTLFYLAALAIVATVAAARRGIDVLFVAYGCFIAAAGAYVLLATTTGSDPLRSFIGGRLSDPIGYANADAALFMIGFWCALPLAASATVALPVRVAAIVAATANANLTLLTESRASIIAWAVSLVAYLVLVRDRKRAIVTLAAVALSVAAVAHQTFEVYVAAADTRHNLIDALRTARQVFLLSIGISIVLFAAGVVVARYSHPAMRRAANRVFMPAMGVLLAIAVVAGIAVAVAKRDRIDHQLHYRWKQFVSSPTNYTDLQPGTNHFSSNLGSSARYDMWRVAWGEFTDHPAAGVGAGNFAIDYVRERRTLEEPQYPHSLVMSVLSETGIVGSLAFLVFAGGLLFYGVRVVLRDRDPVAVAGVVAFSYYLVHAAADWLWEIPAVTLSAILVAGTAIGVIRRPFERTRALPFARVVTAVCCAAAFATLVVPWLGLRKESVALSEWRTDPQAAYDALDQAARLNGLSDRPYLLAGAIAGRKHDYARANESFRAAAARNPDNWYSHLELGALAALQGRKAVARQQLRTAGRLDPQEETVPIVLKGLESGKPVQLGELDAIFLARVKARTKPGRDSFQP